MLQKAARASVCRVVFGHTVMLTECTYSVIILFTHVFTNTFFAIMPYWLHLFIICSRFESVSQASYEDITLCMIMLRFWRRIWRLWCCVLWCRVHSSTLNMDTACPSEMFLTIYESTRRHDSGRTLSSSHFVVRNYSYLYCVMYENL